MPKLTKKGIRHGRTDPNYRKTLLLNNKGRGFCTRKAFPGISPILYVLDRNDPAATITKALQVETQVLDPAILKVLEVSANFRDSRTVCVSLFISFSYFSLI